MTDVYVQFGRYQDFGPGFDVGFAFENSRNGYHDYRQFQNGNYWGAQNEYLVANNVLPSVEIGGRNWYVSFDSNNRLYGQPYRRVDIGYGNEGYNHGYPPNYREPMSQYRGQYYDDFYARQNAILQRNAERYYQQRGGYRPGFGNPMSQYHEQYYDNFFARQNRILQRNAERYQRQQLELYMNYDRYAMPNHPRPDRRANERPHVEPPVNAPEDPESLMRNRGFINDLPPAPPGYDAHKWNDITHQTTKYAVGRAVAADLLPAIANVPTKAERQQIAEQFLRQRSEMIERDGRTILGYKGESVLVREANGDVYVADAVANIGMSAEHQAPGWTIIRNYDPRQFRP